MTKESNEDTWAECYLGGLSPMIYFTAMSIQLSWARVPLYEQFSEIYPFTRSKVNHAPMDI